MLSVVAATVRCGVARARHAARSADSARRAYAYSPTFVSGVSLPLPTVSNVDTKLIHHPHFSLRFDTRRRIAMVAAANVKSHQRSLPSRDYDFDDSVEEYEQYDNVWYAGGDADPFDKGHMVRRMTVGWGRQGRAAARASDLWTNIAPHHSRFHNDEWRTVEGAILRLLKSRAHGGKASVFTGAYFDDAKKIFDDKHGVRNSPKRQVPNAYWKAIVYKDKHTNATRDVYFWVPHDASTWDYDNEDATVDGHGNVASNMKEERDVIATRAGVQFDGWP